MKTVITELMLNPKHDQHGRRHTNGKTKYIDTGKCFVPYQISERNFDIVSQHKLDFTTSY
jgi:hypothetical protein